MQAALVALEKAAADLKAASKAEEDKLSLKAAEIDAKISKLEALESKLLRVSNNENETYVEFNVGGVPFTTALSTLTSEEGSVFPAMLNGNFKNAKDRKGRIIIDRNADCFKLILDYLRGSAAPVKLIATDSTHQLLRLQLLEEAEFFGLGGLSKILKGDNNSNSNSNSNSNANAGPQTRDTSWMETGDRTSGFRAPSTTKKIRFAVSKSNVFDGNKVYDAPLGYHIASCAEFSNLVHSYKVDEWVYYGQAGWNQYKFNGVEREAFYFSDSVSVGKYQHAGYYMHAKLCTLPNSEFAGFVCIKD